MHRGYVAFHVPTRSRLRRGSGTSARKTGRRPADTPGDQWPPRRGRQTEAVTEEGTEHGGGRPRHTASNPRRTLARWPDLPFHSHLPMPRQGHVPWHTRKGSSECAGRRRARDWAPRRACRDFHVTERHRDELKATRALCQLPLAVARAALPAGRPHATYAPEPGVTSRWQKSLPGLRTLFSGAASASEASEAPRAAPSSRRSLPSPAFVKYKIFTTETPFRSQGSASPPPPAARTRP